ncbi:hypothetical protein [Planctomicrobium sp. SH664]|uniref:hypothetical protein n=1 Tax=Planctomicrobium sp. SH664 TaxID=3448125 RepID=UPI003F5C77DA
MTILELASVLSVLGPLMLIATGLLVLFLNVNSEAMVDIDQRTRLELLEDQLRRDVQQTPSAQADLGDPQILQLRLADGSAVKYLVQDEQLRREIIFNDQTTGQENFHLPQGTWAFTVDGPLVRFTFQPAPVDPAEASSHLVVSSAVERTPFEIEARLGAHVHSIAGGTP